MINELANRSQITSIYLLINMQYLVKCKSNSNWASRRTYANSIQI